MDTWQPHSNTRPACEQGEGHVRGTPKRILVQKSSHEPGWIRDSWGLELLRHWFQNFGVVDVVQGLQSHAFNDRSDTERWNVLHEPGSEDLFTTCRRTSRTALSL